MTEPVKESSVVVGTGTVDRTIHVLRAIADVGGRGVGLSALAEEVGLPASTVHRLLKLLVEQDMVVLDEALHLYAPGPELFRISARVVGEVDLVSIVQPALQRVADRFDETVLYGVFSPGRGTLSFAARADGQQLLQYRIEMNLPRSVLWGASGKAVLAQLPEQEVVALHAAEGAEGEPGLAGLQAELVEIRGRGFAVTEGENLPQARGIGVPVFGPTGVTGSLTLTSPRDRLPNEEIDVIGRALLDEAEALSRSLGARR